MARRVVHRVPIRNGRTKRTLWIEPWGDSIALARNDEVVVEILGGDAPEVVDEDDTVTVYGGAGSECRVRRGDAIVKEYVGNPVPPLPPGFSSMRDFVATVLRRRPRPPRA
jgi:hypothetical protein